MILFLSAQDIARMEAGLLDDDGRLLSFQEFVARPEDCLATIVGFLSNNSILLENLKKIVVVSGPGSFTSTRIIVTIANALSFSKNIPVIGLENISRQSAEEIIKQNGSIWAAQEAIGFVSPTYDRPPHITIKK